MLSSIWRERKMEKLEESIVELFKEEHQDWVNSIKKAEMNNEGVDINLGGKFAERMQSLLKEFRDFKLRHSNKKGFFGGAK